MRRNIISVILILSLFTISLTSIAGTQVLYSSNQNIEIMPLSIMFYKGSIYIAFYVYNTTDNSTTFTTFYVLKITNGSSKILLELESKPNNTYSGYLLTYNGKLYIKITQYKIITINTIFLSYGYVDSGGFSGQYSADVNPPDDNVLKIALPEATYVYVYNGSYLKELPPYKGRLSLSVLSYGNHSALLNTTSASLSITFDNNKTVTLPFSLTQVQLVTQNGVILIKCLQGPVYPLRNYTLYYYSWDGKLISNFTLPLISPYSIFSPNLTYYSFSHMLAIGNTLYTINGTSENPKLLLINLLNGNVVRTLNISGLPLGLIMFHNKPTLVVQKVNELLLYSIGERLSKIMTVPLIFTNYGKLESKIFYSGNYFISEVNISSSLFNVTVYTMNGNYSYTTTYNFTSVITVSHISNTLFGVKDNNTYLIVLSNNGSILTTIQLPNVTEVNFPLLSISFPLLLLSSHDNILYIAYVSRNVTKNITSLYLETYKLPINSTHLLISYSFNPLIFGIIGVIIIVIAVAIIKFLIKKK